MNTRTGSSVRSLTLAVAVFLFAAAACSAPRQLVYRSTDNFTLQKTTGNKINISMVVKLYNPNHYAMQLKDADLQLLLQGEQAGTINMKQKIKIPAADTFSIPVSIDLEPARVLSKLIMVIADKQFDVSLKGTLKASRHGIFVRIPVDFESKQDLRSFLQ